MRIQIQLRIIADDNNVISEREILHLDKGDDRLEVIGLSFDEAKAALVRTKALDGTLRDLFTRWYPNMAVNDNQVPGLARAA
jgi:hypothetical protein